MSCARAPVRRGWGRVEGGGVERADGAGAQERRPPARRRARDSPQTGRPRPARPPSLSAAQRPNRRMPGVGEAGVRAGILVTGTEVLSGYITDRNGPWVSERLGELGVEVSQIALVGDRPEDLEAALGAMRDQGMDLIVTTRRPRADGGRPHRRGRGALRRAGAGPRRGDGGQDPRDPEAVREALQLRRGRPARRQPQAGDGARGRDRDRPGRHRPGPGGPGGGRWW